MISWLLAALHLLGLAIGFGAVWSRSRALLGELDGPGVRRVLTADNWWGVSAILLIGTGLLRAFGGYDKGTAYYLSNHVFLGKMGVVALVLVLEIQPMVAFIGWRRALARRHTPDLSRARLFARLSTIQTVLVVVLVLLATAMARGYG